MPPQPYNNALRSPCGQQMTQQSPNSFTLSFPTNYGTFNAICERNLAPEWVDRIWNLALNGYYNGNYFFRVIDSLSLEIIQFGTNGNPSLSEGYNWESSELKKCAIIEPQPNAMPYKPDLSNTFGTISMSTSYNQLTNTTWNATAELFINTGDNSRLDEMLFIPVCTIDEASMNNVLLFPSYGELQELGGDGISLEKLYSEGNGYIANNTSWDGMALSQNVTVSCNGDDKGGPCKFTNSSASSSTPNVPYISFDENAGQWACPVRYSDSCAAAPPPGPKWLGDHKWFLVEGGVAALGFLFVVLVVSWFVRKRATRRGGSDEFIKLENPEEEH